MSQPEVVIAMYRPKTGKVSELEALVRKHFPVLKEYGLTTNKDPFIGRSSDGTIIEVFEWASLEAAQKAHDHPAIAKICHGRGLRFWKIRSACRSSKYVSTL